MDARTRRREPKGIPIGGRFARGGTGADASDLTGPASGRMTRAAVEARARWLSANSDIAAYDADVERWDGQMAEYVAERQAIRDEAYSHLVDAKGRPTKRTQARLDADGIGDVVPLHDRMMMLAADDCADRTDALGVPDPPRPEPPRLEERRRRARELDADVEYAAMADEAAERFGAELPDPARLRAMRAAARSDAARFDASVVTELDDPLEGQTDAAVEACEDPDGRTRLSASLNARGMARLDAAGTGLGPWRVASMRLASRYAGRMPLASALDAEPDERAAATALITHCAANPSDTDAALDDLRNSKYGRRLSGLTAWIRERSRS